MFHLPSRHSYTFEGPSILSNFSSELIKCILQIDVSNSTNAFLTCFSFCLQECLLTNWAHWQGASSLTLKQPTTTCAGEECLWIIGSSHIPFTKVVNWFSLCASLNQHSIRRPLRGRIWKPEAPVRQSCQDVPPSEEAGNEEAVSLSAKVSAAKCKTLYKKRTSSICWRRSNVAVLLL